MERLKLLLEDVRSRLDAAGLAAGISVEGQRGESSAGWADVSRGWGMQTTARFNVGCVTKLLVSSLVHRLVCDGQLALDAPVSRWTPELIGADDLTIRHLVSHTAGYQGPRLLGRPLRAFAWSPFAAAFGDLRRTFAAGTVFNYENTAHVILGEILERVSGSTTPELLTTQIFRPLGITPGHPVHSWRDRSGYAAAHAKTSRDELKSIAPVAAGDFWRASLADMTLTIGDLLTLGEAFIGVKPVAGLQLAVKDLETPLVKPPPLVSGGPREHTPTAFSALCASYAAGWHGYAGSAGGQTCALRFNPHRRAVVAVAINMWMPVARDRLLDQLCQTETHPDAGAPGGNPGFRRAELVGHYEGGGNILRRIDVVAADDGLRLEFDSDGLNAAPLAFRLDQTARLIPELGKVQPGVAFFADPATGSPCLQVGMASLRKCE